MPYHYLRNLGFFLLVMLLAALAGLAVTFAKKSAEQMAAITTTLQNRLTAANELDNALLHASLLYRHDSQLEIVSATDIMAILNSVSGKIRDLRKDFSFTEEEEEEEKALDASLFAVRQGMVSLFELGQQPVDYTVSLLPQIKDHLQRIAFSLGNLAYGGADGSWEKTSLAACLARDLAHDLTHLETQLDQFMTSGGLRPDVVLSLLTLSRERVALLKTSTLPADGHRLALDRLDNLLQKLKTNLPHIYDGWQHDPTISLLPEEMGMPSDIWDEIAVTREKVIEAEKKLLHQQQDAMTEQTHRQQRQFIALAVTSILFAVVFAFFIGSLLSRRIARLIDGTSRLADGDLSIRIDMPARDDIGRLAGSFNHMADSLADKQRELRDSFELLQTSEKLLKLANDQLENRVRERTAALSAANAELRLMGNAFSHALEGIVVTDELGRILKANPATARIVGYELTQLVGSTITIFDAGSHDESFYLAILAALRTKGAWDGEVLCRRQGGDVIPLWLAIARMEKKDEKRDYYICSFRDISEHKKQEMLIRHQAMHDSLTGLPNRLLLKDQTHIAIAHAGRRRKKLVVLFMDLDNFKIINDTLGHSAGDAVLKGVALRLKTIFRPEDTVCRIGGDEFVAIIGDLDSEDFALTIAERILKSLVTPFPYMGHHLTVGGSIGMAVYPDDGTDSDTLVANADQAMYQAKQRGKNRIHFFSTTMHEYAQERLVREEEIRRGLDSDQFTLFFQPIINLATLRVEGFEALARWLHPERGMLEPAHFLQVCEDSGLMGLMGRRLLTEFCRLGREVLSCDPDERLSLSYNLSVAQIQEDSLADTIADEFRRVSLDPSLVTIEISETVIMADPQKAAMILLLLADCGIRIAIDDFGSGYHSLGFLKHLPVHILKIDKAFIRKALVDEYDGRLVKGVTALARHLGLQAVAEGVESPEQLAFVRQCGCHLAQGYLFAHPMPAADIPAFLRSWRESVRK